MEAIRFDELARGLASGRSRRSVVKGLVGGVAALVGRRVSAAAPACRRAGHPCEGNQECCDQLVCVVSGPGAARRCTPCPEGTVFLDGACCDPDDDAVTCEGRCGPQRNNCEQLVDCGGEGTTTCGVGACQRTVENCVGGVPQECVPGLPQPETCNGIDDDCDGVVDNGNPGGGAACDTGQTGVCAAGTTACESGQIVCNQNVQPSAEVCDGLDNNCDGQVDEGDPGGGLTCDTGLPGDCAEGTTRCEDGVIVCLQNEQPDFDTDVNNCGACGNECADPPNASPVCSGGQCSFACDAGFVDCNGLAVDGCEANLATDPQNCGACGNACSSGFCLNGQCACPEAVLSGGPSPADTLVVDDDLEIRRNGTTVFVDDDEVASAIPPVPFANLVNGEELRVTASNSTIFAAFQTLSPLYLHCPAAGTVQVLDADGHPTNTGPGGNVFYDVSYTVAL